MSAIQDSAMLVSISISTWGAYKYDKAVSREVDVAKEASGAGRYNKQLIDRAALEPIRAVESEARAYFYKATLAWSDEGQRILPAASFMEFSGKMSDLRYKFQDRVREFARDYPQHVDAARKRLGKLYEAKDFPENIATKFHFPPPSVLPVPNSDDFRVKVGDEQAQAIRASIEARNKELLAQAEKQCWDRMREHCERIVAQCSADKGRIYDSLMENPREFAAMLPAMNLTQSALLAECGQLLNQLIVPADRLRRDKQLRANTAVLAQAILRRMP